MGDGGWPDGPVRGRSQHPDSEQEMVGCVGIGHEGPPKGRQKLMFGVLGKGAGHAKPDGEASGTAWPATTCLVYTRILAQVKNPACFLVKTAFKTCK